MTNREIKFELAKIALVQCVSMDSVKQMYKWITEEDDVEKTDVETETQSDDFIYDAKRISEIVEYIAKTEPKNSCYPSKLSRRFVDCDIKTVGDLLSVGKRMFKRYRDVGEGSIACLDKALEKLYGIKDW